MPVQRLRPLADTMPEATEEMTLGEHKILQALNLVAARIDDVVQPAIDTNAIDIKGLLDISKGIVTAQEGLDKALKNGIQTSVQDLRIDLKDLEDMVKKKKEWVNRRSVWGDILASMLNNKGWTTIAVLGFLTVLPVLQKAGSALAVAMMKRMFDIDLPTVAPWLF